MLCAFPRAPRIVGGRCDFSFGNAMCAHPHSCCHNCPPTRQLHRHRTPRMRGDLWHVDIVLHERDSLGWPFRTVMHSERQVNYAHQTPRLCGGEDYPQYIWLMGKIVWFVVFDCVAALNTRHTPFFLSIHATRVRDKYKCGRGRRSCVGYTIYKCAWNPLKRRPTLITPA